MPELHREPTSDFQVPTQQYPMPSATVGHYLPTQCGTWIHPGNNGVGNQESQNLLYQQGTWLYPGSYGSQNQAQLVQANQLHLPNQHYQYGQWVYPNSYDTEALGRTDPITESQGNDVSSQGVYENAEHPKTAKRLHQHPQRPHNSSVPTPTTVDDMTLEWKKTREAICSGAKSCLTERQIDAQSQRDQATSEQDHTDDEEVSLCDDPESGSEAEKGVDDAVEDDFFEAHERLSQPVPELAHPKTTQTSIREWLTRNSTSVREVPSTESLTDSPNFTQGSDPARRVEDAQEPSTSAWEGRLRSRSASVPETGNKEANL